MSIALVAAGCTADEISPTELGADGGSEDADASASDGPAKGRTPGSNSSATTGRGTSAGSAATAGTTGGAGSSGSKATMNAGAGAGSAAGAPAGAAAPAAAGMAAGPAGSGGVPAAAAASGGAPAVAGMAAAQAGSGGSSAMPSPAPAQATFDCTRAGLAALTKAYLEALIARDPSAVPFASTVKYTENTKVIGRADGLFKTAGAPLAFSRKLLDPDKCSAFVEAVIDNEVPGNAQLSGATIIGVRLRLDNQQITEVETYVVSDSAVFFSSEGLTGSAGEDWEGSLPDAQRGTREQLTEIADSYFDSYTNALKPVPFGTPCDRLDNGEKQASCGSGLGAEAINPLPVTNRRYPIVDVEAGIAVGFGLSTVAIPTFTLLKINGGKIRFINTGIAFVSQGATSSGWE